MFKLKRKQRDTTTETKATSLRLTDLLTGCWRRAQEFFVRKMSAFDNQLTVRQKKWWWACFCGGISMLFLYLLYSAIFQGPSAVPTALDKNNITRPLNTSLPDSLDMRLLELTLEEEQPDSTTIIP